MSRLSLIPDVRLVFDPSLTEATLSNDAFYNLADGDDRDAVDSVIQNAEAEFVERVDTGYRFDQIRSPETHAVETGGHRAYKARFSHVTTDYTARETDVELNHAPVLPIDAAEGDSVEIRTGVDEWEDVTDDTNLWELVSSSQGLVLVDFDRVHADQGIPFRKAFDRRFIRVAYRYGATGGRTRLAGQTTLGATLTQGGTPSGLSVADASRLPPAPAVLLIVPEGDHSKAEYVRVTDVDTANDTIDVATRGERLTSDVEHGSGEVVHYAPLFVRTAVAKKAAIELTSNDQYSQWLPDSDISLDSPRKLDEWRNDWKDAIALLS